MEIFKISLKYFNGLNRSGDGGGGGCGGSGGGGGGVCDCSGGGVSAGSGVGVGGGSYGGSGSSSSGSTRYYIWYYNFCGNSHRTAASPLLISTDFHDRCQLTQRA